MRSLKTRISIRARPADVFHVLTDFDSYPNWNPWTRVISGKAIEGSLIKVKPYRISYWAAITYHIDRVTPDLLSRHSVGWFSHIVRIDREAMIYTKTDGSAVFTARTRFSGPLARLAQRLYGPSVLRGMKSKAGSLKAYCESRTPLEPKS